MNTQELKTFLFGNVNVAVIDHNQERWMTGEDIGVALEYSEPRDSISKIFERNREELEEFSTTVKLTANDGKEREIRIYNEEGVIIITFLSKQPKAAEFRKWGAKILKTYRRQELVVKNDCIEELLTTQRQLIAAKDDQIAYVKSQAQGTLNGYAARVRNLEMEQMLYAAGDKARAEDRQRHREELERALRSKHPMTELEEEEIYQLHRKGHNLPHLVGYFFRSRDLIKRAIRNQGGTL